MNVPNNIIISNTTASTDKPRFPIFRSSESTLDSRTVVNKKAKTSIRTTSDMNGQLIDKNHIPIKDRISL